MDTQNTITYEFTDQWNADRFVRDNADKVMFVPTERQPWFVWDGQRWQQDHREHRFVLAKETVGRMFDEAARAGREGRLTYSTELNKHARSCAHYGAQIRMVEMAGRMFEEMKVDESVLDRHPTLLNVQNGTVDLAARVLHPHSPADRITQVAFANFDLQAKAPRWEKFLSEIFSNDQELIRYIQRALGYSITGYSREHLFFICFGPSGRNGKTTMLETVMKVLGNYAKPIRMEALLDGRVSDVRTLEAIGKLKGLRFAVGSETQKGGRFNEAQVKKLSGGDTFQGAELRRTQFDIWPTHTLWLMVNHLPETRDLSPAFWDRAKVVPFHQSFMGEKRIATMQDELLMERDGILTWLVAGAQAYLLHGLGTCPAVLEAIRNYRQEQDPVLRFLAEGVDQRAKGFFVGATEMFNAWRRWCDSQRIYAGNPRQFGLALAGHGLNKVKTRRGFEYVDITLRDMELADPEPKPAPRAAAKVAQADGNPY